MKVFEMPMGGSYEIRTDADVVLGWIDIEAIPDPITDTMGRAFVAKPIEGRVKARATLQEAVAHVAGSYN